MAKPVYDELWEQWPAEEFQQISTPQQILSPFEELPPDMLLEIFQACPVKSLMALISTCGTLLVFFKSNEASIWKMLLLRDYPVFEAEELKDCSAEKLKELYVESYRASLPPKQQPSSFSDFSYYFFNPHSYNRLFSFYEPKLKQKATVYQGRGRPRNSDYTSSGNIRHSFSSKSSYLPSSFFSETTVYQGRGRPRNSDYTSSGNIRYSSSSSFSSSSKSSKSSGATVYKGIGRPRNSDYTRSGSIRRH